MKSVTLESSDAPAIVIRNVHKRFRGGKDHVLRGVSIDFPEGKLTYILGPSGTGKSVLIKHVLGLLHPDSGDIIIHGRDLKKLSGRALVDHRAEFGMLFQNSALFDDLTVFENVAFPLREHTKLSEAQIGNEVKTTLSTLGMTSGYDKFPNEISGGMRKRVGLARAIVRKPRILLYDEPTTGLDPVTRRTVDELIAQIKRDLHLTSIVVSHDIPSALALADQIAFIHSGTIAFFGTPHEFAESSDPVIRDFLEAEMKSLEAMRGVKA